MRTLQPDFAAHIASGATTLATCWRVERDDGVALGFTDHDRAIDFAGQRYAPAHGLDGSETVARLGPATQTAEILGVLHSAAITEDDLLLGRYDGARVETWRVNWRDPGQRHLLRVDTIGEIVREDGVFRAELRSGQHALNQPQARFYQRLCDARLGEGRCGVDLDQDRFRAEVAVVAVHDSQTVSVSGLEPFADGWFDLGVGTWTTGRRHGVADRVTRQQGDRLTFDRPVGDWVGSGDTLALVAGCDRRFATCREKFDNTVNFQGFPHIPGTDYLMRYPSGDDRLDGRPLVK